MLDKAEARKIALDYAQLVTKELAPKNVILFGSYHNGHPHEESDIDVAVIFDDFKGNWMETATLLSKLKRKINILIEPHLLDESEDVTGFIYHVRQTGEVLI